MRYGSRPGAPWRKATEGMRLLWKTTSGAPFWCRLRAWFAKVLAELVLIEVRVAQADAAEVATSPVRIAVCETAPALANCFVPAVRGIANS